MPHIMLKKSPTLPPIFRLPDEILEEIVSELDEHSDLLALALTSRICAAMVIPHHTQYRILRVRHTMPDMWAHLARRSDLARNVREVHICEPDNKLAPEHYPTTLIEQELDTNLENAEETVRARNLSRALGHMRRLRTFTWSWMDVPGHPRPTSHPNHENAILAALSVLPMVEHVSLHGKFAMHALKADIDPQSMTYPGWRLANLRSLSLAGDSWVKVGNSNHLLHLIQNSRNLEYLEVPEEFSLLAQCRLSRLKHLRMVMHAGGSPMTTSHVCVKFLQNHPSIESLDWSPIGEPLLPDDVLPNLRSLRSNRHFVSALNNPRAFINAQPLLTPPVTPIAAVSNVTTVPVPVPEAPILMRNIEDLDIAFLDAQALLDLQFINRATLRRVKIQQGFCDIPTLHEIAEAFPNIECLSLPIMYLSTDGPYPVPIPKVQWLDILSRFSKLQVFRGPALWASVNKSKRGMHSLIKDLVQACPHLRILDRVDKSGHIDPHKEIAITRLGEDREIVDYGISPKSSREPFDAMDGSFN